MRTNSPSNEVYGTDVLSLATIVGAGLLLLASITAPAAVSSQTAQVSNPRVETVTVTATPLPKFS